MLPIKFRSDPVLAVKIIKQVTGMFQFTNYTAFQGFDLIEIMLFPSYFTLKY